MQYIKGMPRGQLVLFNTFLDQIISEDQPVRFIDAYVDGLDLYKLGFKIPELRTGTPPYNPELFVKIYIYCYFEKIRSSRKIEKECRRNQELIWLTCNLAPDFKTIADFRKDNRKGLKNIFKDFLYLCRDLNLLSLKITATDGTKMRAQNSMNEVYNRNSIDEVEAGIEEKINKYMNALQENDQNESEVLELNAEETKKIMNKIQKLEKRQEKVKIIKGIFESDETLEKYFATDPDSRFQSDKGQVAPGFNAQICTDEKNKLIIVNDITNQSNDLKQMTPMLENIKEIKNDLDINENTINIMDAGYASEQEIIKNKDKEDIEIYVQNKKDVEKNNKIEKATVKKSKKVTIPQEGFDVDNFEYDEKNNLYICPEGKKLECTSKKPGTERSGRKILVYQCKSCRGCRSRDNCTKNKRGRSIAISVNHKEMNDSMNRCGAIKNKKSWQNEKK